MSRGRIDRLLASAAVVFFVSGAAGDALAGPKVGSSVDIVVSAPAPIRSSETSRSWAKPAEQSVIAAADEPAVVPSPIEGDEVPSPAAPPAATKTPTPPPQPAASSGGDEVPTPAVAAPAVTETLGQKATPASLGAGDDATTNAVTPPATATAPPASAEPPAPAAVVVADPIADQLREMASGKFDRVLGGAKERAGFEAFYSGRNFAPVWITDGKLNERATAAIAYLGTVDADGLDPAEYPVPDFASLTDPAALADAEMRLAASVVTYAHHAAMGRVHWTRVSGDILYELKAPTPAEVLTAMLGSKDIGQTLAAYEPSAPGYVALKAKLAEQRAGKGPAGKAPIANGPALKVGMTDARVPQLRERLGVAGDGDTFDKTLADAVKKFQQAHEVKATGQLTQQTVDVLNGRQTDRPTDIILANMERWRWMPHDLGKTFVIVNLPDFTLRVVQNEHQVWTTKIVDGKPATPTPIMTAEMRSITINPTWNIPDTIAAKEYVPLMRQDPGILERMGLNVTRNANGTIHISQPPGPQNALGQLRFNFPNKFFVYQHDSNEKFLFSDPVRDASHGCMRVENPVKYAEVLLSIARPREGYTEQRIRSMFGNTEIDIRLPATIPVHVTYQTAFVDGDGKLQFRNDIYDRDRELLAILKGDERKVADIPIERKDNAVRREALAMPDQAFGSGNLFSRLFGAFTAQQQPPTPRRPVVQR
jgi:L,D-transpeptidase YcbB